MQFYKTTAMLKILGIILLSSFYIVLRGQNVVIVTSDPALISISKNEVLELYKGNISSLKGNPASFLDHQRTLQVYNDFIDQFFGMAPDQMNEFWVQEKLQSGKRPPKFLPDNFLPKALLSIKGSISYYYEGQVPEGLTVVTLTD